MKKKILFLLTLFALVVVVCPNDVFAVTNTEVKFITNVNDWASGTDLSYSCGTNSASVQSKVYVGPNTSNLVEKSCNFTFDSLGLNTGDDFVIVEKIDFSSYHGTNPEYQTVTVTPGKVVSASVDYDEDDYMFGLYHPDNDNIYLYNMNTVDDEGNITGALYVDNAYFEINEAKAYEKSLGTVYLPSYCVNFHFNVKGNIANVYGIFELTAFKTDSFSITGENGDDLNVCNIGGSALTKAQFDELIMTDATYTGIARSDEYVISVTGGDITSNGGVNTADVYVSATLSSDGSQTGLLYNIIPFIILIALVVVGYLFIKNNEMQDKEII